MSLTSRIVTCSVFEADATTPAEGKLIIYRLMQDGYTLEATVPKGRVDAEIDEDGNSSAVLWCNTEGLRESWWTYTLPDGASGTFQVPEGTDPISLEYLRAQEDIYDWEPPEDPSGGTVAGIYAAFANTSNPVLGDGLVGTRQAGTNSTSRTVHAKINELWHVADFTTLADAVTAAAGQTLVINTAVTTDSVTVPATVALRFEQGGSISVNSGQTLTINGPMEAGRHQIFSGSGTVDGTPRIEASYPEWFGAAGSSAAVDAPAIQKAAAFYPHVLGSKDTIYRVSTVRAQHTTLDIYSRGKVQDYTDLSWSQFPNGVWYGVRLPEGCILDSVRVRLTTGSTVGRHHAAFVCGNANYGRTAFPDVERLDGLTIRDCEFTIDPTAQVVPWRTTLAEDVGVGQTEWTINLADFDPTRMVVDEPIRLKYASDLDPLTTTLLAIAAYGEEDTTTVLTVADGPVELVPASSVKSVVGPVITPMAVAIIQSVDNVLIERNHFDGTFGETLEKLIGFYPFDVNNLRIQDNIVVGLNKLVGLDYCRFVWILRNRLFDTMQLCDMNKVARDVVIAENDCDRSAIDSNGDGFIECNGGIRVKILNNKFRRGSRCVMLNTKGPMYGSEEEPSWIAAMNQDETPGAEAYLARKNAGYFSVWRHIQLRGNYYEWIALQAITIGDSWKVHVPERADNTTSCGYDVIIDDVAVNCLNSPFYSRYFGVIQIDEGRQIRIRMHIDNPAAVRAWLADDLPVKQNQIVLVDSAELTILAAGLLAETPIRVVQDTLPDDWTYIDPETSEELEAPATSSAGVYTIQTLEASTLDGDPVWIATVDRDISYGGAVPTEQIEAAGHDVSVVPAATAGAAVWIGPGNGCGISARSWISTNAIGRDEDDNPIYAVGDVRGATEVSDCEILELSGSIKNTASQGLFAYQASMVNLTGLSLERVGSRDRSRIGALSLSPSARSGRLRGSISIDNSTEKNQAGNAQYVASGLRVGDARLNDSAVWSTTRPFLSLWQSRIVGHLSHDLDLADSATEQVIRLPNAIGGTFTLTGNAQTTAALSWQITAAALQTAIRALGGDYTTVDVTGSIGGPYTVTSDAGTARLSANGASLTGTGASAFVSVALHTITLANDAGGTFTLTGNSNTTAALAFNLTPAALQTAIRGLGGAYANADVYGVAGGTYNIGLDESTAALTADGTGLTGTSPKILVGVSTNGSSGSGTFLYTRIDPYTTIVPLTTPTTSLTPLVAPVALVSVPARTNSSTLSPAWVAQTGGQFVKWTAAHTTQDHSYINFITPPDMTGVRTIKAKIVGTSTPEDIIIKSWWAKYANGDAIGWDATNSTQQAVITVADTMVTVTIAVLSLVAGEMNSVRFRPRTTADANLTQDKQIVECWLE